MAYFPLLRFHSCLGLGKTHETLPTLASSAFLSFPTLGSLAAVLLPARPENQAPGDDNTEFNDADPDSNLVGYRSKSLILCPIKPPVFQKH
jgi:hypothetical protein